MYSSGTQQAPGRLHISDGAGRDSCPQVQDLNYKHADGSLEFVRGSSRFKGEVWDGFLYSDIKHSF
jgi:hypothetical protein